MKRLTERIGKTVKGRIAEAKLSSLEEDTQKYILREFGEMGDLPPLERSWKD